MATDFDIMVTVWSDMSHYIGYDLVPLFTAHISQCCLGSGVGIHTKVDLHSMGYFIIPNTTEIYSIGW